MGGGPRNDALDVSIDYPNFKLRVKSGSKSALSEVRRIVEALNGKEDDFSFWFDEHADVRARLSDEFLQHQGLAARLRSSTVLDEEVRVLKSVVPVAQAVDLITGEESRQVSAVAAKQAVTQLFDAVDLSRIRECLVHIRGELEREQQSLVMDAIKQRLGLSVPVRFFSTRRNLEGRVLVEAVCFADQG